MKYLLLICSLITLSFGQQQNVTWKRPMTKFPIGTVITANQIIGGTAAVLGQIPFQASILAAGSGYQWFCGGSIIHASWVLTAAHCVVGATSAVLRFGTITPVSGGVTSNAAAFIPHPAYDPVWLHDDIALIRLATPLTLGTTSSAPIQKIDILPKNASCSNGLRTFQVSGWGKTSDAGTTIAGALFYTKLTEITDQQCMQVYGTRAITPTELCAFGGGTTSTCSGDSGGPLITLVGSTCYLAGVVSFGASASCVKYPGGFVETTPYLDWIRLTTGIQTF